MFSNTTFTLKLVQNDDGYHIFPPKWRWFTRAHYLVLRKSRTRSRTHLKLYIGYWRKLRSLYWLLALFHTSMSFIQKGRESLKLVVEKAFRRQNFRLENSDRKKRTTFQTFLCPWKFFRAWKACSIFLISNPDFPDLSRSLSFFSLSSTRQKNWSQSCPSKR